MLPAFPEPTRRRFARNLLRNALRLKRRESLLIETWSSTLEWAESVVLEARIIGARPMLVLEDEATFWKSLRLGDSPSLGVSGAHDWAALKASDAHVYFVGPMDVAREEALPQAVQNRITANDHEWFRLVERFGVRSARWQLGTTSEVLARRYGVNLNRWRSELIDASTVDPQTMRREGTRISGILRTGQKVRITHPNGTKLSLRLAGRKPRLDDGVVDATDVETGNVITNLPSGVVTVAVSELHAEGGFRSNETGVMSVERVETALQRGFWRFEDGLLRQFSYTSGGEPFRREFRRLGSAGFRPGLLSIGLNPGISSIPLMMDQAKGNLTVELGRNIDYGGATRTPHIHVYQHLRGGTLEVDGAIVVKDGAIV